MLQIACGCLHSSLDAPLSGRALPVDFKLSVLLPSGWKPLFLKKVALISLTQTNYEVAYSGASFVAPSNQGIKG